MAAMGADHLLSMAPPPRPAIMTGTEVLRHALPPRPAIDPASAAVLPAVVQCQQCPKAMSSLRPPLVPFKAAPALIPLRPAPALVSSTAGVVQGHLAQVASALGTAASVMPQVWVPPNAKPPAVPPGILVPVLPPGILESPSVAAAAASSAGHLCHSATVDAVSLAGDLGVADAASSSSSSPSAFDLAEQVVSLKD